jgi:Fe-S cluster assembly scaffold protein SufB
MAYEKLAERSVGDHARVSMETDGLYARHSLSQGLPGGAKTETARKAIDALVNAIIKETKLKFDLTNGGGGLRSESPFVKIIRNTGKRRHDAIAESLGHYMLKASRQKIVVDVPAGRTARLNFLMVCGNMDLPVEVIVNVGEGARLDLFEWWGSVSENKTLIAPLHVVNAERDSRSEISLLHNENGNTAVGNLRRIIARAGASVKLNVVYNGGSTTKTSLFAEAAGAGSEVSLNEIVLGNVSQAFDLGAFMLNSGARSRTSIRSGLVLGGGSHCVLKGYAKVSKEAAGSFSSVEQRGLLLDSTSKAQLLPDMSVECRDVASASHSASVAPIGEEDLFYLMSRGMPRERARRAFVAGFVSKYLAGIGNDTVKEIAISIMLDKFDSDGLSGVPRMNARDRWTVPAARSETNEA